MNYLSLNKISVSTFIPVILSLGLLLSICTNLRFEFFPIGPGEILLSSLAILGFFRASVVRLLKAPVAIFWLTAGLGMLLGALTSQNVGGRAEHHAMAYSFTALLSIGLAAMLVRMNDAALRRSIFWLCLLTSVSMWLGFLIYLTGDAELFKRFYMFDSGDVRYSGWSVNPNQLALFFVPLPVWLAAIWRNQSNPTKMQMLYFATMLFALMLMGLLVRSDGLFVVWIFEFFILIGLRIHWETNASRLSILAYALILVLCVFLVKTFAHGEVRKSVRCAAASISKIEVLWSEHCYEGQAFQDQEAFRIGYSDPATKTVVREELWTNGLEIWVQSPWVGNGPGEFSWLSLGGGGKSAPMESHNITIDLLTQGGILAGGAWLAFVLYLIIRAWHIRDSYTFSVVIMMTAFTFFHNTRQPYFWFVMVFSYEAICRKLFVKRLTHKIDA